MDVVVSMPDPVARQDIRACLVFAHRFVGRKRVEPVID